MPEHEPTRTVDHPSGDADNTVYWNTLYQVMEYAVDVSEQTPLYIGNTCIAQLDEEKFLSGLYIARVREPYEETISAQMVHSIPVVCIGGKRGCGKTSAIVQCLATLRKEQPKMLGVKIDIKSLYDERAFEGITADNATSVFRKVIRCQLFARLFPFVDDAIALVAWMLAGPPDGTDSFPKSLVGDVHDLAIDAQTEAICSSGSRKERRNCLHAWLSQKPDAFREHLKSLQPRLRAAHYVRAFVALSEDYDKIVLVFDNVDRIPGGLQSEFLCVCNDGQLATEEACTTVIAIRTENMRGDMPRPGQDGDIVRIVLPDDEEYPGILLPSIGNDHIQSVLTRRHEFTSELILGTLGATNEQHDLLKLDKRIANLKQVHSSALRELIDNQVCALSNGSMRTTLSLYTGFMRYLDKIDSRRLLHLPAIAAADPEKHFHTLFFLWLREKGGEHGVFMHDVLQSLDNEDMPQRYASLASVHHLLLACILKLTQECTRASTEAIQYPPWNEVWARMKCLGFSYTAVQEAMEDFTAIRGDQPRAIELVRPTATADELFEDSVTKVRLTPLGAELIRNICHKAGYLWSSAAADKDRPIKTGEYFSLSRKQRMHQLYGYCTKLIKVYLRLMAILRIEWSSQYGEQWYALYVKLFAVDGKTQTERILESCAAFFWNAFTERTGNAFEKLHKEFQTLLNLVVEGTAYKDLPFDTLTTWNDFWSEEET